MRKFEFKKLFSNRFYPIIEHVILVLEIILSLFLIIGVIGAGVIMAASLYGVLSTHSTQSFQQFLDEAFLYLIGLEVAMMLIKRDAHLVVDILTFAIARKMIMNMEHGVDFLFGALAILVLYLVKGYGSRGIPLPRKLWRSQTNIQHNSETNGHNSGGSHERSDAPPSD